jgi:hypothetical protein
MRVFYLTKVFFVCVILLMLAASALADVPTKEAAKLLPDRIGEYQAQSAASSPLRDSTPDAETVNAFNITSAAMRYYASADGKKVEVLVIKTASDSAAYSFLTEGVDKENGLSPGQGRRLEGLGTAAFEFPTDVFFFKGDTFVVLGPSMKDKESGSLTAGILALAHSIADTLDKGTGEIPSLINHLPSTESVQARAVYAINLSGLKLVVRNQPILDAVSFEGGTEAVIAKYDQGQLVIVEFQTPQLASDADARITARIAELRGQHQPVPAAYKREGNYAVFVFDAPTEQAAAQLAGQVKYEKVVQWLGNDPHRFERANRFWLNMSGSIILNTIKATGLAIILCLSVGGLFGGVIFMRRRAQAALSERYSDAGGMMRLNLDELAGATNGRPQLLPRRDE